MDIEPLLQGIKDGIEELVKQNKTSSANGKSNSGASDSPKSGKEKKEQSIFEKVSSFVGGGFKGARSAASGIGSGSVGNAAGGLARGAVGLGSRAGGALAAGGAVAAGGVALGVASAVAGVAAIGAAAAAAGVAITKLAEASVESARSMAGFNATLATSFATADIRNMQRNISYAGVTADSTAGLQDSLQDLYDAVAPIQALIRNAWNGFLQWGVELITKIVEIAKLLPWIGDKIAAIEAKMNEREPNMTPLNAFFDNLAQGNFRAVRDPSFAYPSDDRRRGK